MEYRTEYETKNGQTVKKESVPKETDKNTSTASTTEAKKEK